MTDKNALNVFERYNDTGINSTVNNASKGDLTTLIKTTVISKGKDVTVKISDISIIVKVAVNKASGLYDNANNITSSYQHEQGHINDVTENPVSYSNSSRSKHELSAIKYQREQPIYRKTTSEYQKKIDVYEAQFKNSK